MIRARLTSLRAGSLQLTANRFLFSGLSAVGCWLKAEDMGFLKSLIITVAMELMPESMLDMAAAKTAVMSRPEMPAGRC